VNGRASSQTLSQQKIFSGFGGFFDKKWDRTSIEIVGISSKTGQRKS